MNKGRSKKAGLTIFLLIIAVIVIVIMGIYIYKTTTEETNMNNSQNTTIDTNNTIVDTNNTIVDNNNTIVDTNNTIVNNTNTIADTNNTIVDNNNTITDTNNTIVDTNDTTNNKEDNSDIVGTWNTYQAIDAQTAEKIDDLTEIFGSSYRTYGSFLKLNNDGTFLDSIYPVTTGETSTNGTYTIEKDYYKLGDCYIFLNYSDGRTVTVQRIYYEDNTPVLSYYTNGDKYQFDFKKQD